MTAILTYVFFHPKEMTLISDQVGNSLYDSWDKVKSQSICQTKWRDHVRHGFIHINVENFNYLSSYSVGYVKKNIDNCLSDSWIWKWRITTWISPYSMDIYVILFWLISSTYFSDHIIKECTKTITTDDHNRNMSKQSTNPMSSSYERKYSLWKSHEKGYWTLEIYWNILKYCIN